jgi:hypothetical protein
MRKVMMSLVSATLGAFVLAGCEGDSRPFEEAVEIRTRNITALTVSPPAMAVDDLFINRAQSVQFSVQGRSVSGQSIPLSASDRDWRVTDASVATITDSGLLTGRDNGEVGVFVSIGGLDSELYTLQVSDAELSAIQAIIGPAIVERCRPEDYRATGVYDDGSVRDLLAVNWALEQNSDELARVASSDDGSVTLTGLNTGVVDLIASSGEPSQSRSVEIGNSLTSLSITPSPAGVDVGRTQAVVATGSYIDVDPVAGVSVARERVITDAVDWQVTSGTEFASVSNTEGSRGRVTGLEEGSATLSASCGNVIDTVAVTVSDTSPDPDELSFNEDSPLILPRSLTQGVQLRVAEGSTYSAGNDVTSRVTWTVSTGANLTTPVSVVREGVNAGLVRPLAIGEATITATLPLGGSVSIIVRVTNS